MIEARFEYRCRRCGEITGSTRCNVDTARQLLVELSTIGGRIHAPRGAVISMHTTHRCDDDGEGLADLIGYKIVDTEPGIEKKS